jgi:hypothetical protein
MNFSRPRSWLRHGTGGRAGGEGGVREGGREGKRI